MRTPKKPFSFYTLVKTASIFIFLLTTTQVSAQTNTDSSNHNHHCFFEQGSYSAGFGVPYLIDNSHIGLNTRAYYNLTHAFCFGPEYTFATAHQGNIQDVDLVAHYIFELPWFGIYPLAGANYTLHKQEGHTNEAFGLLWGAGVHRNIGPLTVFTEYSRVESVLGENFITLGLLYSFSFNLHKN